MIISQNTENQKFVHLINKDFEQKEVFGHKKRRKRFHLFLPQIYHELNLLMLWYY